MDAIKTTRAVTKGQITKIKNYAQDRSNVATIFELTSKLELLENYYKKFDSVQTALEQKDEKELLSNERDTVDEDYCTAKSKLRSVIASLTPADSSHNPNNSTIFQTKCNVKLPRLPLPSFDGNFSKWTEFWNSFSQMVDENPDVDNVNKFQYLKGCLGEKPANVLSALDVTAANYPKAIEKLKLRYNNKRFIFQSHIKDLFEIPDTGKPFDTDQLRSFIDVVTSHIESLYSIATKEEVTDGLLIFMASRRLDQVNKVRWEDEITSYVEENTKDNENKLVFPSWSHFTKFVEIRCQSQENVGAETHQHKHKLNDAQLTKPRKTSLTVSSSLTCVFCKQSHNAFNCPQFNALDQSGRFNETRRLSLCTNCLLPGHNSKKCRSTKNCRQCRGRHHTLLHWNTNPPSEQNQTPHIQPTTTISQSSTSQASPPLASHLVNLTNATTDSRTVMTARIHSNHPIISNSHSRLPLSNPLHLPQPPLISEVILSTAIVFVTNSIGQKIPCRTLLDGGSQPNFITKRFASILGLQIENIDQPLHISGISNSTQVIKSKVTIVITSSTCEWSTAMEAYILSNITPYQPSPFIDRKTLDIPSNIKLADPKFHQTQKIDLLIGNGYYLSLLSIGQIKITDKLLLQKTNLGWIIGGTFEQNLPIKQTALTCATEQLSIENIDRILGDFWKNDDLASPSASTESNLCELHFQRTHTRHPDGKYEVQLPFKDPTFELGNSYETAMKCFLNLEKKLSRNDELRKAYTSFIEEYSDLGHLERVSSIPTGTPHFFLPHHPVIKAESSTTKLRVVFNASKKTSNGKSLNDILLVGPTIQDDLFYILLRFRVHRYILGADITKMYRQVQLHKDDQWLQLILWRSTTSEPINILKLKTVTYGTAPAAFLAIRSLVQLAKDEREDFPLASKIVLEDFYVDNLLTGADDIGYLKNVKSQVTDMLRRGSFPLKKWISNADDLLDDIADADKEKCLQINDDLVIKTLGMAWQNIDDVFIFNYNTEHQKSRITKRSVLSEVSSFFDPAGLIAPVILTAKIFIQTLWKLKLQWDESLPQELHTQWEHFRSDLEKLRFIRIPRYVSILNPINRELHGFCDASLKAYAACIYLRTFDANGNCDMNLLCSKTRVVGLKPTTIARLELCGAHLLAELMSNVTHGIKSAINSDSVNVYLWTDSSIALCWIRSDPSALKTFVSNRVSKIQALSTNAVWNHIPGSINPADWSSRGKESSQLSPSSLWFKGPEFLRKQFSDWPPSIPNIDFQCLPERKVTNIVSSHAAASQDFLEQCKFINSYQRLLRVFSYVFRLINKVPETKFTPKELQSTLHKLCRYLQQIYFHHDYKKLTTNQQLDNHSKLKALAPFIDCSGVMRVGGRTRNADLAYDEKHQIIIPRDHPFTVAIISFLHLRDKHSGEQACLYALRQQFWILSAKRKVRSVIRKCIRCFRARPIVSSQVLGNLPRDRLQPVRPFTVTGLDFCGPFNIRPGFKGGRIRKYYLAIFVCFFSRAVHLEVVSDLTTDAFLSSLKRFTSRRGKPSSINSDNATNFVGGRNKLKELYDKFTSQEHQTAVYNFCLDEAIEWSTIPPRSPHFGGLWEAAVKIAKHHLVRVFGSFTPILEDFSTVVCQVEAIMNSRPLSPMSCDPNDFEVLTPGHFLTGAPLNSIPEPNVTDVKFSRLSHFQQLSNLHQTFEKRWKHEVMNWMQVRNKNTCIEPNLEEGDLVLLVEDNYSTMKWPRGRIVKTYPSPDDKLVRVVDVKLPGNSIMKRAVTKVCKLPMDVDSHSNQPGGV